VSSQVDNQSARVDDWWVVNMFGRLYLCGQFSGHPKQSEFKSKYQISSVLVEFNKAQGYAVTRSGTRFSLGVEWPASRRLQPFRGIPGG